MRILNGFLAAYGPSIVCTALTALAGVLGIVAKRLLVRFENDKTKKEVAELCVQAVEQGCRELHGTQKFQQCAQTMAQMLAARGVPVTDLEIKVFCEAVLARFNEVFARQSSVRYKDE